MNTTTEEPQVENEPKSDSKLLLAPLATYGVIALFIAGLIITTTIIMSRDLNSINEQVATAEQHIASLDSETADDTSKSNTTPSNTAVVQEDISTNITVATIQPSEETVAMVTTKESVITNQETNTSPEKTNAAYATASISTNNTVAQQNIINTDAQKYTSTTSKASDIDYQNLMNQRIEQRNTELVEQDKKYLETYKDNQANQIQYLRKQLVLQQERINEIEQRYQKNYEWRASNIERNQKHRQAFLQPI